MRDYLLSDKFELAAFKGQGLTFRHWDQQLREPILLASPFDAGLGLAAGRLPAPADSPRHARLRRAGFTV
jgi:hypothetical protein